MKVTPTALPEVLVVEPTVHRDDRGFFLETYQERRYAEHGITGPFLQDNHSSSTRNTVRGLHAQRHRAQAKLVRAVAGEMLDVAVDIREGSPSFGRWVGVTLSGDNFRQLYIPAGFAHGFCVLSDVVHVEYKCSQVYDRDDELTVAWDDPQIGIVWPISAPLLSHKDRGAPRLSELAGRLPVFTAA